MFAFTRPVTDLTGTTLIDRHADEIEGMKASYLLIAIFLILANGRGIYRSSIRKRLIYEGHKKDIPGPKKNYTGLRLREDSALLVYYHDQTVAIVEVGANRELFNCEILEVRLEP